MSDLRAQAAQGPCLSLPESVFLYQGAQGRVAIQRGSGDASAGSHVGERDWPVGGDQFFQRLLYAAD